MARSGGEGRGGDSQLVKEGRYFVIAKSCCFCFKRVNVDREGSSRTQRNNVRHAGLQRMLAGWRTISLKEESPTNRGHYTREETCPGPLACSLLVVQHKKAGWGGGGGGRSPRGKNFRLSFELFAIY